MKLSLNTILSGVVLGMGIVGLLLTLLSGTIHEKYAFDNQQDAMYKLSKIMSQNTLTELVGYEQRLGLNLQKEKKFRKAFKDRDDKRLYESLYNEYNRYFVTTDLIKLEKLVVFSKDFDIVAELSDVDSILTDSETACKNILHIAKNRTGASRIKMLNELCSYKSKLYHLTLVPIGGIFLRGYIAVITDPSHNLKLIEKKLDMPIRLELPDNTVLYQSDNWPENTDSAAVIISSYFLVDSQAHEVFHIHLLGEFKPMFEYIHSTKLFVLLIATLIILLSLIIVNYVLRITTLNPLTALTFHLKKLGRVKGGGKLEKMLDLNGAKEMQLLGESFNNMTGELNKLYDSLEDMAFTDEVTTLPNRFHFQRHILDVIECHQRRKTPFALFLMDLDRFKTINDTLGHDIGDMLLLAIGSRLKSVLRNYDVFARINDENSKNGDSGSIARLGGDEFAALTILKSDDEAYAGTTAICNKILQAMEEPFVIDGHTLVISLSIGVVIYPLHGDEQHELMRKADVAMYHSKKNRSGYSFYQNDYDDYGIRYLALSRDLLSAISDNQMELYYQPKVDIRNDSVVGVEALIRWNHPSLGQVSPFEFIPIAEQSGQIGRVTEWVVDRAIEQCALWNKINNNIKVSINLSATNLQDHKIVDKIVHALTVHGLAAEMVILEITESAIMSDYDYALNILKEFRNMNLKLSIDDFGTGHSSLSYVKHLPVNELKIDKLFIDELCVNSIDEAIVKSIIVLGHHMGLQVVAEGVEQQDALDKLKELDCDIVQGYFFAKPMPYDKFIDWLASR